MTPEERIAHLEAENTPLHEQIRVIRTVRTPADT
jgi:hypothetical protein